MTSVGNDLDQVLVTERELWLDGPPHELFRSPSHPRTQAFLRAVVDRQTMAETSSS